MIEYTVIVRDGDKVVHNARCRAKNVESAKSKCLSDCWKLDKMLGVERKWHTYRWEIYPSVKQRR